MGQQPRRWNIRIIRKFLITFGIVSSVFDFLTIGLLLSLQVIIEQFRAAWFLESVVSASLIVFVVRSSRPFFSSRPGKYLVIATGLIAAATLTLPFTPFAAMLEFQSRPPSLLGMLARVVVVYLATAEIAKRIFIGW